MEHLALRGHLDHLELMGPRERVEHLVLPELAVETVLLEHLVLPEHLGLRVIKRA
jgi:hypothetical protein